MSPLFILFLAVSSLSPTAPADEQLTLESHLHKVVVRISATEESSLWIAQALQENITRDLVAYPTLRPVDERNLTEYCEQESLSCLLDAYQKAGISILFLGSLQRQKLEYEVFDIGSRRRVLRNHFPIGKNSSMELMRLHTFRAFRPFIERGGILDQKVILQTKFVVRSSLLDRTGPLHEFLIKHRFTFQVAILLFLVFLTLLPFIMISLLRFSQPKMARQQIKSLRWSLLATYLFLGLFLFLWHRQEPLSAAASDAIPSIVYIIGGAFWALFLRYVFSFSFHSIFGIDQMQFENLSRLLRLWFSVSFFRLTSVTLACSPFFLLTLLGGVLFGIGLLTTVVIVVPLFGIVFLLWFFFVAENFAYYLDGEFVIGDATQSNPWHQRIEDYLVEYGLRCRSVIHSDGILFLPGRNSGVIVYGGGISQPRIVIDEALLITNFGSLGKPPVRKTMIGSVSWQKRDFLFGGLLHGMGKIYHREHIVTTLTLTLESIKDGLPFFLRDIIGVPLAFYHRLMAPMASYLADAYAVINGGLHHLAQFLFYESSACSDLLTIDADSAQLFGNTQQIFMTSYQPLPGKGGLRARLLGLAAFVREKSGDARRDFTLPVFSILFGLLALVFIVKLAEQSYHYHGTYIDRMEVLKQRIKEQKREKLF